LLAAGERSQGVGIDRLERAAQAMEGVERQDVAQEVQAGEGRDGDRADCKVGDEDHHDDHDEPVRPDRTGHLRSEAVPVSSY